VQASADDRLGEVMQRRRDQGLLTAGQGCSPCAAVMMVEATQGAGRQRHGSLAIAAWWQSR
jgi:hypothetical protein